MTADTQHDILLWSIVIPAMALVLFARSIFTALSLAPAASSRPPTSFLQLFQANLQTTHLLLGCLPRLLAILTLSAVCSAAAWLAPSWYLQRGREQLLAGARLLPKGITVLQLLLLPSHPLGTLQRVWLQTSTVGAKGLLGVLIWPLLFPVRAPASLRHATGVVWMFALHGAVCCQAAASVSCQGQGMLLLAHPMGCLFTTKQNKSLRYGACAAS
jgi:hypothetical protein